MGTARGLGSGVFGVKIDNVDADGPAEIWCGDAGGHIYLFALESGEWHCTFRSPSVGAYPGMYNKIFPIKDGNGETVELIVKSSGYLMRFEVDLGS